MRTLAIMFDGKTGTAPENVMQQLAQANQPAVHVLSIETPLSPRDARILADVQAWHGAIRSGQSGVNLLIESLLVQWLTEATGTPGPEIVQRLAVAVEKLLPPAWPTEDPADRVREAEAG